MSCFICLLWKAFLNGWRDVCKWNGKATLLIPLGEYVVNGAVFKGPCNGWDKTFEMRGVIKAPIDPKIFCNEYWILFKYIDGLKIKGHGTFDGQGACAWGKHQCAILPFVSFKFFSTKIIFDEFHFNYILISNKCLFDYGLYEMMENILFIFS